MVRCFLVAFSLFFQTMHCFPCVFEKSQAALKKLSHYGSEIELTSEQNKISEILGQEIVNGLDYESSGNLLEQIYRRICFFSIDGAEDADIREALLGVIIIGRRILTEKMTNCKGNSSKEAIRSFSFMLHSMIASFYSSYHRADGSLLTPEEEVDQDLSESSEDEDDIGSIKKQIDEFIQADNMPENFLTTEEEDGLNK